MTDAIIRKINVHVEIDIWDKDTNTKSFVYHVTQRELLNFTFQKTIKNPNSSGTVTLTPQYNISKRHFFNHIKVYDVVRIYEFGELKFIGLIRSMSTSGTMGEDGTPTRTVTLQLGGMGGYLSDAKMGLSAYALNEGNERAFASAFTQEQANFEAGVGELLNKGNGLPYQELVDFALQAWFNLLNALGGDTRFDNILSEYFDLRTAVGDFPRPYWPREFRLVQGNFEEITIWSLLNNLLDIPFNEMFFDEGPRQVVVNGSVVDVPEKTSLVIRDTPFNNTLNDAGVVENRFDALPDNPITGVISYNFTRSVDDVYTLYASASPIWDFSLTELVLFGQTAPDRERFSRYLYRPMQVKLNNIRIPSDEDRHSVDQRLRNTAENLKRWFENNDNYINGVITSPVPERNDWHIGDKVSLPGAVGHFYCESITHEWQYGSSLICHTGVTRGYDYSSNKPMILSGEMFEKEGGFK